MNTPFNPITPKIPGMEDCSLCPRGCNADRYSLKGSWCNSGSGFAIASICNHKGEEPVLSGSKGMVNVFFSHCNLQCIYCQNYQISSNKTDSSLYNMELKDIITAISELLDTSHNILGFVSPSHYVEQVKIIIEEVRKAGRNPVIVYNTNGYDKASTIRDLEEYVDVWLPDFKYSDPGIAAAYSKAGDYPEIAKKAIMEMYRQKGSMLYLNDEGVAESGMIIRHLVLPGNADDSIEILRFMAENLSTGVHISLMSQYYPTVNVRNHPKLGRPITEAEYRLVANEMERLGFYKGWLQEPGSGENYQPDFLKKHPFD